MAGAGVGAREGGLRLRELVSVRSVGAGGQDQHQQRPQGEAGQSQPRLSAGQCEQGLELPQATPQIMMKG